MSRPPLPNSKPGHHPDLTYMVNGDFRAECSCGWWSDSPEREDVYFDLLLHMREVPCTATSPKQTASPTRTGKEGRR